MDENVREALENLLEALRDGSVSSSSSSGGAPKSGNVPRGDPIPSKVFKTLERVIEESAKRIERLGEVTKLSADQIEKLKVQHKKEFNEIQKERKAGKLSNQQYARALQELQYETERLARDYGIVDSALKNAIKSESRKTTKLIESEKALSQFKETIDNVTDSTFMVRKGFDVLTKGINVVGGTLNELSSATDGVKFTSKVLKDVSGAAFGAAEGIGSTLTAIAPALGKLKIAATIGGVALEAVGKVGKAVSAQWIDLMTNEVQKSIKTFRDMSNAGVMFANGMDELRTISSDTGISMETLSAMAKTNAASLAKSGMPMQDAFIKMTSAIKSGGASFQNTLLNLGYTIEESGGLIAETMSNMRMVGLNLRNMTGGEVAAATAKYAESLRVISAITGEDAKKRMEEARDAAANSKIQAELAKMGPEAQEKFLANIAMLPAEMRKAVLQKKFLGTVVDTQANVAMSTYSGLRQAVNSMSDRLGGSAEEMAKSVGDYKQAVTSGTARGEGQYIGVAGLAGIGGVGADQSAFQDKMLAGALKGVGTADEAATAIAQIKAQAATQSKLNAEINNVQRSFESIKSTLEGAVATQLKTFAGALGSVSAAMEALIKKGGKDSDTSSLLGDLGLVMAGTLATSLITSLGGKAVGAIRNKMGKGPGNMGSIPGVGASSLASIEQAAQGSMSAIPNSTAAKGVSVAADVTKTLGPSAAKATAAKFASKLIPGIGLAVNSMLAMDRYQSGDYLGAAMTMGAGVASMVPGIGTGIGLALDAAVLAKDAMYPTTNNKEIDASKKMTPDAPKSEQPPQTDTTQYFESKTKALEKQNAEFLIAIKEMNEKLQILVENSSDQLSAQRSISNNTA